MDLTYVYWCVGRQGSKVIQIVDQEMPLYAICKLLSDIAVSTENPGSNLWTIHSPLAGSGDACWATLDVRRFLLVIRVILWLKLFHAGVFARRNFFFSQKIFATGMNTSIASHSWRPDPKAPCFMLRRPLNTKAQSFKPQTSISAGSNEKPKVRMTCENWRRKIWRDDLPKDLIGLTIMWEVVVDVWK